MSSQVQKLETLLTRVRQRRSEPRAAPASVSAPLPDEVTQVHRSAPPTGSASPLPPAMEKLASPPTPAGEASAPAVDGASSPAARPVQDSSDAKGRPITLPDAEPLVVPTQADRRIAHAAPEASGAVARSQGEAPDERELTFEQLIARSLALRPRG